MRFFVPDGDPRKGTPAEARKADKLNWEQVERYQNDGYGVYFVINGGGHADKDVQQGRSLFCEWDDRPIEDQILAWQELNLLEPTMQVGTRKSIHNYWRADLTKEQWIELQQDLLIYTQSDQKLKNPSRVLRLAGCWHVKPGCEPIRCDIIHQSERVYTYEELRATIPRRQKIETPTKNYQPSITDDVPLYQCLTKDDRALIDQGAAQGNRNSSGAKLSRNLIGTAHRLNYLGIRFDGDPRQLFDDYCSRCAPALASREADTIWKSASKDNPTASLTDEALENCSKAWIRNQGKTSGRGYSSSDGGNDDGDGGNQPPNQWQAPTTWNGEIGWLIKDEDESGLPITKFYPKCNFDFQIEAELSSDIGGGLVLQVKRSLDSHQKRVIISSQDYGSAKDFEAALKRVYKTGVVCNLKTEHLKALIHVKLREYRDRDGITYRLQDRAGQQEDGHWVFKDCQLTAAGEWSATPNSDWIFNEELGGEDKMPQPSVASPNPDALKRLVAAMLSFHGAEGIFPALMALGFSAAAVHYKEIIRKERRFPQLNLIGDAGSNKSVCATNALSLVGWLNGDGQISGVSESKLYECLKLTGSLPLCLDDPPKSRELDEILKRLYNGVPRLVRGNYQQPHSPLMITSNHAIGDQQLATFTRMLQVPVYRQSDGDAGAWDEMVEAMEGASGCLPDLIKLGYPKAEIRALEQELRSHLPKSHPRIASSMALITWYAMAVARLASFDADSIKRYVIAQLCPIANAADSNSDSITDFLDKLSALKSDALVGDWNCLLVETKAGKALAVQMSQVFPLVDKYFNPVYSRKVLEALIAKAGGNLQSVQKFHSNRDESLAYYRARITAESEFDPREPEYKPKRCVLIPIHLIKGFTDDWKPPIPPTPLDATDTLSQRQCDASPHNDTIHESVTFSVTSVTSNNSQLHKKCNQQDVYPVCGSANSDSLVTSFSEKTIDLNQKDQGAISEKVDQPENSPTLIPEKDVTETFSEAELPAVIESERLHNFCNQDVTGCNQDVTEPESAAVAPTLTADAVDTFTVGEQVMVDGIPGIIAVIDLEWPQAPYRIDSTTSSKWFAASDIQKLSPIPQQVQEKPREAKVGDRIQHGEFTGVLAGKAQSGWYIKWNLCPSLLKRYPAPPAVLRDGEFKLL
jgi:hypothetical protein